MIAGGYHTVGTSGVLSFWLVAVDEIALCNVIPCALSRFRSVSMVCMWYCQTTPEIMETPGHSPWTRPRSKDADMD